MNRVLSLRNRQRGRALALPLLRRITRHVLEHELAVTDYELCFHFVESEEMARANRQFLQHDGSTDVITFDYADSPRAPASGPARGRNSSKHARPEIGAPNLHGEIFISVADAVKQAREFRTTWQMEIVRYVIHGLLHLRGHDDLKPTARQVMKREENRLVKRIASQFAIEHLARTRNSKLRTQNFP